MNEVDRSRDRVISGECWDDFCDALKQVGRDIVLAETAPENLLDRAEGWRYLARLTRAGLRSFLEPEHPQSPEFRQPVGATIKMGMDNPDNAYFSTRVNGNYTYRIKVRRNSVHFLGFGSQAGGFGKTGNLETTGSFDASSVELDDSGCFELIASINKPESGHWLPMRPETRMIQARQSFGDRNAETLADLEIECIDEDPVPPEFNPLAVDRALQSTVAFVRGTSTLFAGWAEGFKAHKNQLPRFDPDVAYAAGGDPKIAYYHSYFELRDDEALVVDLRPPECEYWNIQLSNYWLESLDYRHYQIHLNQHTAMYREDGSVQVVISKTDPGVPNWLNTAGHDAGTMCVRWLGAKEHPTPEARLVKLHEISSEAEAV